LKLNLVQRQSLLKVCNILAVRPERKDVIRKGEAPSSHHSDANVQTSNIDLDIRIKANIIIS